MTNNLVGVLTRFRQEPVAFCCDIEGMFHQVRVNEEHGDFPLVAKRQHSEKTTTVQDDSPPIWSHVLTRLHKFCAKIHS